MTNNEKMIHASPEFAEKLANAQSKEEFLSVLNSNGIEMNEAEALEMINSLNKNGDVSESDLEEVTGGGILITLGIAAIKGAWAICPGQTNQQKAQYICNYWYNKIKRR